MESFGESPGADQFSVTEQGVEIGAILALAVPLDGDLGHSGIVLKFGPQSGADPISTNTQFYN